MQWLYSHLIIYIIHVPLNQFDDYIKHSILDERQKETAALRDRLEKETSDLKNALQKEIKDRESERDNFKAEIKQLEKEARDERKNLKDLIDKERAERANQAQGIDDYFRLSIIECNIFSNEHFYDFLKYSSLY